jgi:hypothetical protein
MRLKHKPAFRAYGLTMSIVACAHAALTGAFDAGSIHKIIETYQLPIASAVVEHRNRETLDC